MVDKDAVSLPVRSRKLFSLSALYDANEELLKKQPSHTQKLMATNYFARSVVVLRITGLLVSIRDLTRGHSLAWRRKCPYTLRNSA